MLQVIEQSRWRLNELGVTYNRADPMGQYAEYLVCSSLGGEILRNNSAGHDLFVEGKGKVEVKCRLIKEEGYIPKTTIDAAHVSEENFDYLVYVALNPDFSVSFAFGMSLGAFKKYAKKQDFSNGKSSYKIYGDRETINREDVDDLTYILKENE